MASIGAVVREMGTIQDTMAQAVKSKAQTLQGRGAEVDQKELSELNALTEVMKAANSATDGLIKGMGNSLGEAARPR